jgi:hypothetical protein
VEAALRRWPALVGLAAATAHRLPTMHVFGFEVVDADGCENSNCRFLDISQRRLASGATGDPTAHGKSNEHRRERTNRYTLSETNH